MEIDSFPKLLELLLPLGGGFILRNSFSTGEYKGEEFTFKLSEKWCTIYPKKAESSEDLSHIHLKWGSLKYAEIKETDKRTPQLGFWEEKEHFSEVIKPPFVYVFPSFFDWGNNAEPILENQKIYSDWILKYGKHFNLAV